MSSYISLRHNSNLVFLSMLTKPSDEENAAAKEIKSLSEAIKEIERILRCDKKIIESDGGAHLFASSGIG